MYIISSDSAMKFLIFNFAKRFALWVAKKLLILVI
jgi:hypothetical protein